jgi:hypothetical protein
MSKQAHFERIAGRLEAFELKFKLPLQRHVAPGEIWLKRSRRPALAILKVRTGAECLRPVLERSLNGALRQNENLTPS